MIDEHKLLRDAERAAQAQALLDNALLNEAYAAIDAQLVSEWKDCPCEQKREAIWQKIHANEWHKNHLQAILNDGKLAAAELKELAFATERKKRYGVI